MQPKTDVTVYRTKGDTDPMYFDLKVVMPNGITGKVPSTANVALSIVANTVYTVYGTSSVNGQFAFSMTSVNTANIDIATFQVRVSDTFEYVLGTGTIYFKNRIDV